MKSQEPTIWIANTIIKRAKNEGLTLSSMKLQKLMYLIYQIYLKKTHKKLFIEPFAVYKTGPVIESLFLEFDTEVDHFIPDSKSYKTVDMKNKAFSSVFEYVWARYSGMTAISLSKLILEKSTAYNNAYKRNAKYLEDKEIFKESW